MEKRVTKLEKLIEKKFNRKKREYTEEEKKAIRERLLAGQKEEMKAEVKVNNK